MSEPQHEPTMEEILASIRKIISEDAPETPPPAEAASAPVEDHDILELTQEFEPTPSPAPAPVFAPSNDVVFETIAEEPMTASSDNGIFSDHTRAALDNAFASIPDEPAPLPIAPVYAAAPLPSVGGTSVENVFERAVRESFEPVMQQYLSDNSSVVIDRMKPLIREWMDEHFPALLEGAVRAEVERVVKARGNKR